jgi:hypothetical protein
MAQLYDTTMLLYQVQDLEKPSLIVPPLPTVGLDYCARSRLLTISVSSCQEVRAIVVSDLKAFSCQDFADEIRLSRVKGRNFAIRVYQIDTAVPSITHLKTLETSEIIQCTLFEDRLFYLWTTGGLHTLSIWDISTDEGKEDILTISDEMELYLVSMFYSN